jgi:hypothetical protein
VERRLVGLVGERAEQLALALRGILEERERLVGVTGDDHLVEPLVRAVTQSHGEGLLVAADRRHRAGTPHPRGEWRDERFDVAVRPSDHGLPLRSVTEAEHPVVVQELGEESDGERP